jgi:hypothetical protein
VRTRLAGSSLAGCEEDSCETGCTGMLASALRGSTEIGLADGLNLHRHKREKQSKTRMSFAAANVVLKLAARLLFILNDLNP